MVCVTREEIITDPVLEVRFELHQCCVSLLIVKLGLCLQNFDPIHNVFHRFTPYIFAYVLEVHVIIYWSFLFRNISPGLPAQA